MANSCGVPDDDGISPFLKCKITQQINGNSISVTGYLTESCDIELRSLWESPFGQDSLGDVGKIAKTASIGQSMTENTSKTQWNSQQTWEGTEPPEITIQLKFIAYTNALEEVNKPIMYLMQMASPELLGKLPVDVDVSEMDVSYDYDQMNLTSFSNFDSGVNVSSGMSTGRIPQVAAFDLGRRTILPMRISSVSYDLNAPKTKQGYFAYNTVTITAAPKQMFNRSDIPNIFRN